MRIATSPSGEFLQQTWDGTGAIPETTSQGNVILGALTKGERHANARVAAREQMQRSREKQSVLLKAAAEQEYLRAKDLQNFISEQGRLTNERAMQNSLGAMIARQVGRKDYARVENRHALARGGGHIGGKVRGSVERNPVLRGADFGGTAHDFEGRVPTMEGFGADTLINAKKAMEKPIVRNTRALRGMQNVKAMNTFRAGAAAPARPPVPKRAQQTPIVPFTPRHATEGRVEYVFAPDDVSESLRYSMA